MKDVNEIKRDDEAPELWGLVLAGGRAQRMGLDKALLNYSGKPQAQVAYDELGLHCQQVFLSRRWEQRKDSQAPLELPTIYDRMDIQRPLGPMAGILSAFDMNDRVAWMVLACDLPLMKPSLLEQLVAKRNPSSLGTVALTEDETPQPVCAIYEPACFALLEERFKKQELGLKKIIREENFSFVQTSDSEAFYNANSKNDYLLAKRKLQNER